MYTYIYTENGTDGKRQLPFVCCKLKRKWHTFFVSANGKRKFVFLGPQTKNSNRISASVPSKPIANGVKISTYKQKGIWRINIGISLHADKKEDSADRSPVINLYRL
jgi:hypothetical protein